MSVSITDVKYIAELAKLKFDDAELDELTSQMNEILLYIAKLDNLDTDETEPLSHPVENENIFREDKLKPSLPVETTFINAPLKQDQFFAVPKVISK